MGTLKTQHISLDCGRKVDDQDKAQVATRRKLWLGSPTNLDKFN